MCSCEMPKVQNEATRTARKAHRCCECRRIIERGERYQYVSGIWDEPMSFKTCLDCAKLRTALGRMAWDNDGDCGPCFGEAIEYMLDADMFSLIGSHRHTEFLFKDSPHD